MISNINNHKLQDKDNDYDSKISNISDTKNDSVPDTAPRSSYSTDVQYMDTTVPLLAEVLKVLHTHTELLEEILEKRHKPRNNRDGFSYEL